MEGVNGLAKNPDTRNVSKPTLRRLPEYLNYLRQQMDSGKTTISATAVSADMKLNEVQVRKDLSSVSKSGGKPKTGYVIKDLINDISEYLGYNSLKNIILVGVGQLGGALLSYKGFEECGFRIVAGFDTHPSIVGMEINGKIVYPNNMMKNICELYNVEIGIIAVGETAAQSVCNLMIESGIRAIWNFAPVHLVVPDSIIVRNEHLSASLAILSKQLDISKSQEDL